MINAVQQNEASTREWGQGGSSQSKGQESELCALQGRKDSSYMGLGIGMCLACNSEGRGHGLKGRCARGCAERD